MSLPIVTSSVVNAPATNPQSPVHPEPTKATDPTPKAEAQAHAAPQEAPAEPTKAREGSAFAALTRQEKAFRAEQAKWKADRDAQQKEWDSKIEAAKRFEETRTKAKTDKSVAFQMLQDAGLTLDDLTQLALNDNKPTAEMIARQAQERVDRFEQEQRDREKKALEDQQATTKKQEEAAVAQFHDEIGAEIDKIPEGLVTRDDVKLVYHVIEQAFLKSQAENPDNPRVLSTQEAIAIVETERAKEIEEKWLTRAAVQKLIAKRAGGTQPGTPVPEAGAHPAPDGGAPGGNAHARVAPGGGKPVVSRTLTNSDATSGPTPTKKPTLSREESMREAAKLLRWTT